MSVFTAQGALVEPQEAAEIPKSHSSCPLTCHSSELQCPLRSQGGSVMPPAPRVPGGARAGQPGRTGTRAATGVCPPLCKLMLELFYIKTGLN